MRSNKRYYILFHHHFLSFLNSKINDVTNSNPFNLVNKSFSIFLTADSGPLICNSGLKEFKIKHCKYLHNLYKHVIILLFLPFFSLSFIKKDSCISLCKGPVDFLSEPPSRETFLISLLVLFSLAYFARRFWMFYRNWLYVSSGRVFCSYWLYFAINLVASNRKYFIFFMK